VAVLDPDIVLGPVSGSRLVRGAAAVASRALGLARIGLDWRPALINGSVRAVSLLHGNPSRLPPSRFGMEGSPSSTSSPTASGSSSST
jgi:hypothetical protein